MMNEGSLHETKELGEDHTNTELVRQRRRVARLLLPTAKQKASRAIQSFERRVYSLDASSSVFESAAKEVQSRFRSLSRTGRDTMVFYILNETHKDMDDDIRLIMAEIKAMTEAKQKLRQLIKELNAWISAEMSEHNGSGDIINCKVTGSSPNEHFRIRGNRIECNESYVNREDVDLVGESEVSCYRGNGDDVTIGGLKSLLGDLKRKLDGLSETSEKTSLRLQAAMERRSKLLATLSKLLKKVSTTQDALIQNIK